MRSYEAMCISKEQLFFTSANEPGRHPRHNCIVRDIFGDNCTGAHDGMRSDADSGQNCRIGADISTLPYHHGLNHEFRRNDGHVDRQSRMRRAKNLRAGTPADIVFENEIACVKIGLRADPYVITNPTRAVVTTLNHCLSADEDSIPEHHAFGMLYDDSRTDLQGVPDGLAHGAKEDAPKLRLKRALIISISGKHGEQLDDGVRRLQMGRKLPLPNRIFHHLRTAEHRRHGSPPRKILMFTFSQHSNSPEPALQLSLSPRTRFPGTWAATESV